MAAKSKPKLPKKLVKKFDRESRLRAAAHEAGHLVVGAVQGFTVRAEIGKDKDYVAASMKEFAWGGKTDVLLDKSSAEVGVAGIVGQGLWNNPNADTNECLGRFYEVYDDEEGEQVSETDRLLIPEDEEQRNAAIRTAYKIIKSNWHFFEWARKKLLEDGSIAAETVEEYCKRQKVKRRPHPAAKTRTRMQKLIKQQMAATRAKSASKESSSAKLKIAVKKKPTPKAKPAARKKTKPKRPPR